MSEIIPNVVVSMPSQLFTMARSFKACSNGRIYIGKIDTDPTIPENRIQVYLESENGDLVPASQPIIINAAGYPVYAGQIAKFVTVQGHSMAIYDSYGTQQFYFPNVLKYDPDRLKQQLESENGADLIGGLGKKASISAGVISATEFGVKSGVCNKKLLQELQDLSESLRIPIDFSGIREVCFEGYIAIGDWFHWRSSGRFDTTIKPASLTRSTVGTNSYGVYAWFTRKDPTKNLIYAMLEDIGIDGQYQGGYEIEIGLLIRGFCWHADNGAVLTDITASRCHFKNMPHEGWEGYTTNGGQIDGIRYLFCSSEGEDPAKTSVGFNAFKCMNGTIDSPPEYGIYTIRNIISMGNIARGHRTLTDLKRGCEKWSISSCTTYDMNDCHHSTDGS
ncbi:phage head-binding domain-containing protein, partial [Xenorhabdus bovienii]|uniref:phage head-binding domain-containing protein n=1 Tax=Xenorhabdus bovienii TaxID=40576 RepID=UPI003DA5026E